MTPREKKLAVITGLLVAALGLLYAGSWIYQGFAQRQREIARLRSELDKAHFEIQRGIRIAEQLNEYAERALPKTPDLARSLYQNWLVSLAADRKVKQAQVGVAGSIRNLGGGFQEHQFTLGGHADLEQLTRLLYDIQFAPILHSVKSLSVEPIRDQRDLNINMTLAVVAMPTAPERQQLPRSSVTGAPPIEEYLSPILNRNLFGPENQPPRLRLESQFIAYRGQPFELRPEAEDPDKWDTVRIEIDASALSGARTSRDGRLAWTPQGPGEYSVTVRAVDDGFPARETKRTVRIVVRDPPPPPPAPSAPPPPSFNPARFAVVTGITSVNGQPQVWVTVRTEGRTLKLSPGQKFQIGPFEGELVSVDGKEVVFRSGDKTHVTRLGESLLQ